MIPHLLCCQGLAVIYYSFALGRLESVAPSTFALLGYYYVLGRLTNSISQGYSLFLVPMQEHLLAKPQFLNFEM